MERVKLEIKKIENPTNRQVKYSKWRNGLIKQVYEFSVLCNIDLALILFSPSWKLTQYSNCSMGDVIGRFANLPMHERNKRICSERLKILEYATKFQEVKWGNTCISMNNSEHRLLANALLDFDNELFVLLWESCAPL